MPELAEVAFFRRRWDEAAGGSKIIRVLLHPKARIFRGADVSLIEAGIPGEKFSESFSAAKQILIRFGQHGYLGIHLGMSGDLAVAKPDYAPGKHDHLVLYTKDHALVFSDPRMFGRVRYEESDHPPFGGRRSHRRSSRRNSRSRSWPPSSSGGRPLRSRRSC